MLGKGGLFYKHGPKRKIASVRLCSLDLSTTKQLLEKRNVSTCVGQYFFIFSLLKRYYKNSNEYKGCKGVKLYKLWKQEVKVNKKFF